MYSLSSVSRLSVTFVRPTQPVKIFGNVSTPFNTLAIRRGRVNTREVAKYSD